MRRTRNRQTGYSFIEVLTAIVILSFAVAAVLPVFSNSLRAAKTVEARTLARLHLESLLSEVGVSKPLAPGDYAGAFDDGMAWEIIITPQRMMQDATLFHIAASVSSAGHGGQTALRIETMRIGPSAPAETGDGR